MKHIIEIITNESGIKLNETITKSIETHTEQLDQAKRQMDLINELKTMLPPNLSVKQYDDCQTILEFNALLNISILDLAIISRQLYLTKVKSEQLFYVKYGYTIICATVERYEKQVVMIKKLIDNSAAHLDNEYRELGKDLRKFKKDFKLESHMKSVRNGTAAHVESFLSYYSTLLSIQPMDAFNAIIALVNLLTRFINFSTRLLNAYNIN